MPFYPYPREDDVNNACSEIQAATLRIRSKLAAYLSSQQAATNALLLERQRGEDILRQAFEGLDQDQAEQGAFQQVIVETFKRPLSSLNVDLRGGYATLPLAEATPIRLGNVRIVWEESSTDGIPGSFVEAPSFTRGEVGDLKQRPQLTWGHEKVDAAVDGSASSVFEWERCALKPGLTIATDKGEKTPWELMEPDRWETSIAERGVGAVKLVAEAGTFTPPLRLTLECDVQGQGIANLLEIVPYREHRMPGFRLEQVVAVTGRGRQQVFGRGFSLDRPRALRLSPSEATSLRFTFVQDASYDTTVAHHYWEEVLETAIEKSILFFRPKTKVVEQVNRIEDPNRELGVISTRGPTFLQQALGTAGGFGLAGGLEALNRVVDNATTSKDANGNIVAKSKGSNILQGFLSAGLNFLTAGVGGGLLNSVVDGLWGTKKTTKRKEIREGWDIFPAQRWAIGLAEITLSEQVYEATGTAVLGPFVFDQPVRQISVHATYQTTSDEDEVKLELSADNQSWREIGQDELVDLPTQAVWVRVTLSRGENALNSPLLHEVRVYGV